MTDRMDIGEFIDGLRDRLPELDEAIQVCDAAMHFPENVVKVLSSSILFVLGEMKAHLCYFEERIQKSFKGASLEDEQQ